MALNPVFIAGNWHNESSPVGSFSPNDPQTGASLEAQFPISSAATLESCLAAGSKAAQTLANVDPEKLATFLEKCASNLEQQAEALVAAAHRETGLPVEPRLRNVELPRTTGQLRQAAHAARERSACMPTVDTAANIRSMRGPLGGPVVVFGPNNFPFAFNAVMGGDFAAAIAAGNPVIAKAHPGHPETSRLLTEAAAKALAECDLPAATVQMLYALDNEAGTALVADPRIGATAFTGSRHSGLALKRAADAAGKPIFLELSAVNPLFVLPGALQERGEELAKELADSCLLGAGQFCTKPGLSILPAGDAAEAFASTLGSALSSGGVGALFGPGSVETVAEAVAVLQKAGAKLVCGGTAASRPGFAFNNTLLRVSGSEFLANSAELQTEAFASVHLLITADGLEQMIAIAETLEGSLTGCVYTHSEGEDDSAYDRVAAKLRPRVGRLLNDKMPTGVAVSAAMNHGGPYPSTGHPGFTSVGVPGSMARFTALHCYDNVRSHRLPPELRDENQREIWRSIDGEWTRRSL